MISASTEALLHPIRMSILTVLAEGEATPQEIASRSLDVPKASLYRHLNILRAVGAIREVREYRVRGTYEKVYALETATGPLAGLAIADGSPAARISEWLNQMVRVNAAPVAEKPFGGWRRSAVLTSRKSADLKRLIEDWLDANAASPDDGAGTEHTIQIDVPSRRRK